MVCFSLKLSVSRLAFRSGMVAALVIAMLASACDTVDDTRIPQRPVFISFTDVGVWNTYGVAAALDYRSFIKDSRLPSGFPYTAQSGTGFGGVLLVCDFDGVPHAFDLACPVEIKAEARIVVNSQEAVAECPVCHSVYDVFRLGQPLSGKAAGLGYGLTRYSVVSSAGGAYMTVTR